MLANHEDIHISSKTNKRKCLGELKDFLNKENFSDSSFSFNKGLLQEEPSKPNFNNSEELNKNVNVLKKTKDFLNQIQRIFEEKALDFKKSAFLKIYKKMEKFEKKILKVLSYKFMFFNLICNNLKSFKNAEIEESL